MSAAVSPKINTDSLVLYYDFSNPKCYPGTGSTVNSLTGNYSGTLSGSPAFSQSTGGNILMDGVDDFLQVVNVPLGASRTVEMVYSLLNPSTGWGPLYRTNDRVERIYPTNVTLINSTTTYYYLAGPQSNTNIISTCYSFSGTNAKCYRNGVLTDNQTMSAAMSTGTYNYRFGYQEGGASVAYINMRLYSVKFYDKQLTDDEVLRNYETVKGRFGY